MHFASGGEAALAELQPCSLDVVVCDDAIAAERLRELHDLVL